MDNNQRITQLAGQLGEILLADNLTVTAAESCTGGGIAEAFTRVPGSSRWFEVGFVTYSNMAKSRVLGVEEKVLASVGAVSQPVVEQMVNGVLLEAQADIAVAVSGIAGPDGGSEDKPVGTVWFAWARDNGEVVARLHHFSGDRLAVRHQSVVVALEGLIALAQSK